MTTTINRLTGGVLKKLSPGACRLLLAIKEEPDATLAQYMEMTGYSKRWVSTLQQELRQAGLLMVVAHESTQRPSDTHDQAYQTLADFGVDSSVAHELAKQHSLPSIEENIRYVQARPNINNRPGYLVKRLRERAKEPEVKPAQVSAAAFAAPVQPAVVPPPPAPVPTVADVAASPIPTEMAVTAPTAPTALAAPSTKDAEWWLLAYGVLAACGCLLDGKTVQAVQSLYEQHYTAEDVGYFLKTFWPTIWPGNKGEPPTLEALMKHIGHAKHLLNMAERQPRGEELLRRIALLREEQVGTISLKSPEDLLPRCMGDPRFSPYAEHPLFQDWVKQETEAYQQELDAERTAVRAANCPDCRRSRQECICAQKAAIPTCIQDRWNAVMGQLQIQLDRATYDNWLRDLALIGYVDGEVIVEAPNRYVIEWLDRHLLPSLTKDINRVLRSPSDAEVRIRLCAKPQNPFILAHLLS